MLEQREHRRLAVVERHVVDVVEHARIGELAQLGVDVAAAEDQPGRRRDRLRGARDPERAVEVARERRGQADHVGAVLRDELGGQLVEHRVDQRRLALEGLAQGIEASARWPRAARRSARARTRDRSPRGSRRRRRRCRGSRGASRGRRSRGHRTPTRADRRPRRFPIDCRKPWSLGQQLASDDAQREARIATLEETHHRVDCLEVPLAVHREMPNRRGRPLLRLLECAEHALEAGAAEHAEEQLDRRVGLADLDVQRGVLAQETCQIRRRGVRRIQLRHRRGDEKEAQRRHASRPSSCGRSGVSYFPNRPP